MLWQQSLPEILCKSDCPGVGFDTKEKWTLNAQVNLQKIASNHLQIIKWYLAMQAQVAYAIKGCAGLDEFMRTHWIWRLTTSLFTGKKPRTISSVQVAIWKLDPWSWKHKPSQTWTVFKNPWTRGIAFRNWSHNQNQKIYSRAFVQNQMKGRLRL